MEIKKIDLSQDICKVQIGNEVGVDGIVYGDLELDVEISSEFTNGVISLIDDTTSGVILDFCHITYIDSTGLWAIFEVHKKLAQKEKIMCVINPQKDVARVFQITKMDQKFPVLSDEKDAIDYICTPKVPDIEAVG